MAHAILVHRAGGQRESLSAERLTTVLGEARNGAKSCFAPERAALVAAISDEILRRAQASASPGIVHFAYWTRRAALQRMAQDFRARLPAGCRPQPRGLVFHLPPQNVETMFLYSWVMSYLVGNANITRLPSALSPQMEALLGRFLELLEALGDRTQLFVSYPADEDLNRAISAAADARVVWGGNQKIRLFADLPLRDGGKPIWFGDRTSLAVIQGDALLALAPDGRNDLAARLFNDIFVFDQVACSSPHCLYVVGNPAAHGGAVDGLLRALDAIAAERYTGPETGHVMRKMTEAYATAGRGEASLVVQYSNALTATILNANAEKPARVGGGFLSVRYLARLDDLAGFIREDNQTLTYGGFDRAELDEFAANLGAIGLTRIVPIGKALDFDVIWDGYDLLHELTRMRRVE